MSDPKRNLKIENREMLHNRVCSILRSAILRGDFKPGERLVQMELADLIGVSRMPIREALRQLEIEGLVKQEPHKGAVVSSIKKEDIMEIYELRTLLEPLALKKSVKHFNDKDIEALQRYHRSLLETEDEEEYIELNIKFHQILLNKCHSPRLLGFINTISRGFSQDTPHVIRGQIQKSNKEHEKIVKAVIEKDEVKASEHLASHIRRTGEELMSVMDEKAK